MVKFEDDGLRLIQDSDESAYRHGTEQLVLWRSHKNLEPNVLITVESLSINKKKK